MKSVHIISSNESEILNAKGKLKLMRHNIVDDNVMNTTTNRIINSVQLFFFHIFHIFILADSFKMLYSYSVFQTFRQSTYA